MDEQVREKSMKNRILFVIDNLKFGGGERVFSQIINNLCPDKYSIFICSSPGGSFYNSITNNNARFLPLDFSKRFNPPLFFRFASSFAAFPTTKTTAEIIAAQEKFMAEIEAVKEANVQDV